jgi:uncharacterized protein YndB with AHSA1/START domain
MILETLPHQLTRTIDIDAPREVVFRFFTDPHRWAEWWGAGSTIDARPGGRLTIRYPNAVEAAGEVVDVAPPERIVFTYGYVSGTPIPAGSSRVTITLEQTPRGTRLHLVHEFADAYVRDQHVQGWRYQLSVFANIVTNDLHSGADAAVDAWFRTWSEPDESARQATLTRIAAPQICVRDRFSAVAGLDELLVHIAAFQRFMPDIHISRTGPVQHCQGMLLVQWAATGADGQPRGHGTNVFQLDSLTCIESVTGFWS